MLVGEVVIAAVVRGQVWPLHQEDRRQPQLFRLGKKSITGTEYDTASDGLIFFKNGWKKFLTRTRLEIGADVLVTCKTKDSIIRHYGGTLLL
ncbi:hypothetical protein ZWY2020_059217 [Hordeum vulgare]|nr:hypothetical protein ZWY2020_059217 [Hordeum vulgare]